MSAVLAIDPGREKCGIAVVAADGPLAKEVVPREHVSEWVPRLAESYDVGVVVVGDGTGGRELLAELSGLELGVPVLLVDETRSSERARSRFFDENPPRGIRRFVPRGLLTPPRPYDDYVAQILAEDYLRVRDTT